MFVMKADVSVTGGRALVQTDAWVLGTEVFICSSVNGVCVSV